MPRIQWKEVEIITKADKSLKTKSTPTDKPGYRVRSVLPASWLTSNKPVEQNKESR